VDGLEVLRRLKNDERTRSLPVVVLTSSKEEPDIASAYRLGANSYIVKPWTSRRSRAPSPTSGCTGCS